MLKPLVWTLIRDAAELILSTNSYIWIYQAARSGIRYRPRNNIFGSYVWFNVCVYLWWLCLIKFAFRFTVVCWIYVIAQNKLSWGVGSLKQVHTTRYSGLPWLISCNARFTCKIPQSVYSEDYIIYTLVCRCRLLDAIFLLQYKYMYVLPSARGYINEIDHILIQQWYMLL